MLTTLFGWLPSYQFTFGALRAATLTLMPPMSSRTSNEATPVLPSFTQLFNDKYTTDAWVYYVCSTTLAVILLGLADSVRARALLSPAFTRISQMLTLCPTPDSLKQPPLPASIVDDDVRFATVFVLNKERFL